MFKLIIIVWSIGLVIAALALGGTLHMPSGSNVTGLVMIAFYLLPGIVAAIRQHHNQNAIFLLNIFLGWTILGWIIAIIWAVSYVPTQGKTPAETSWLLPSNRPF
jgi:Fe2+ transport system protein B